MVLKKSTGEIITDDYEICASIWKQARGLMFSRKKNLIFSFKKPKLVPLHNFFVFFPITVLFFGF